MKSLYTTPESKAEVLAIYQQKLDELNINYEEQDIETTYGNTHVIITGNPENPPLVLVHGSNGCAPIALEVFPNLSQKYRVFAVDVLAQPNRSAETRPNMKTNAYGKWLNEVIARLDLYDVTLAGFSFGGLVIWKTLLANESRIKEAFLIAPAGIVNGNPLKAMWRMFIPMKRYMKTQKPRYLEKFLKALFSQRDEFALRFLSKVFLCFDMDFSPIPTIKTQEARQITTPVTIVAAGQDVIFPGKKLLKRAGKIFPSLKHTLLLEQSKHVQNQADNVKIEALIMHQKQKAASAKTNTA